MTEGGGENDTPLVILNRKRSASDWGSIPRVIPRLMRDPDKTTGFPFSRE